MTRENKHITKNIKGDKYTKTHKRTRTLIFQLCSGSTYSLPYNLLIKIFLLQLFLKLNLIQPNTLLNLS